MLGISILCWVAFVCIVFNIDPTAASFFGFGAFYTSLFLALAGSFFVIGILIYFAISDNQQLLFRYLGNIFLHSLLLSSGIIVSLILLGFGLLRWWNELFVLLIIISIEGVFYSYRIEG